MQRRVCSILLLAAVVLGGAKSPRAQTPPSAAQTPGPVIFFTDITSGPNTGGESVSGFAGAYVTIYGNYFGAAQGTSTITLNGLSCVRVVSWGQPWLWYQKVVVQLGTACTTGKFSITVGGQTSTVAVITLNGSQVDPSLFTVRPGNISCVSQSGSDSNPGTFSGGCWATIPKAVHTVAPDDTIYVENGVFANVQDPFAPYNAAVSITTGSGTYATALLGYPGANAGINTTQGYGIRIPNIGGNMDQWTLGELSITTTIGPSGQGSAVVMGRAKQRFVALTVSCPNVSGNLTACMELSSASTGGPYVYGVLMTAAGVSSSSKTYHGLYCSSGCNHSDIGWSNIGNVQGCRGIQYYNSSANMYDIHIHDNIIHDTKCDGVNLSTVDPGQGPVEAYNNFLYNVGKGPSPPDGSSAYKCFNTNSLSGSTGIVQIYNNSCFNSGTANGGDATASGAFGPNIPTQFRNNIVYQTNGQPYITTGNSCNNYVSPSSNNEFFGNGAPPSCAALTNSLNVDPKIVSTSAPNFHLQTGSPVIDAGVTISSLAFDHDGVTRPQGAGYDIGAYEYFAGGSTVQKPNPPTNLTVVVQ